MLNLEKRRMKISFKDTKNIERTTEEMNKAAKKKYDQPRTCEGN